MVAFAEAQGLKALIRTGGTLDTLRHLITAGFPALVENTYYEGDPHPRNWMSHNRIIVGYDDAAASVYTYDPLLGFGGDNSGRPMPYAEFDETWRHFSRVYLVVYRPSDEPLLRAALGSAWDETVSRDSALEQAQTESDGAFKDDAFALFNTGAALTDLGRYDEAAPLFDRALEIGLPWRFLWYRFEPFEAYIQIGRYDDVLKLVKDVLTDTPGVEEMYYYAGRAYEALGNTDRAKANYQVALQRNKYFRQAAEALAALTN
jgi:tetratricopeptide (TPR) repeat protein